MVYRAKGDDIPTVVQVECSSLRAILGNIRTKSIPISSHLQAKYMPRNSSSNGHVPTSAEEPEDAGHEVFTVSLSSDVPLSQGQANSADSLVFSRSQLSHVVNFTISGFDEKRTLPASMFSDLAEMAKQALPDAGEESGDLKDLPQSQFQKVIECISNGCLEIAASVTKEDSTNDAYGED